MVQFVPRVSLELCRIPGTGEVAFNPKNSGKEVIPWSGGSFPPHPPLTLHLHMPEKQGAFYWRFSCPESTPCASMLFKTNNDPASQAGRRRFESGLPLQNQQLTNIRKTHPP